MTGEQRHHARVRRRMLQQRQLDFHRVIADAFLGYNFEWRLFCEPLRSVAVDSGLAQRSLVLTDVRNGDAPGGAP